MCVCLSSVVQHIACCSAYDASCARATLTRQLQANLLMARTHCDVPVVHVGVSIGARVASSCCIEFAHRGACAFALPDPCIRYVLHCQTVGIVHKQCRRCASLAHLAAAALVSILCCEQCSTCWSRQSLHCHVLYCPRPGF